MSAIFRRELAAYFATPLAFVFLIIFLITMGAFTFYVGHFYENGVADLSTFFGYHPWLYLMLMPALAMRLWAEERRGGTLELLLTLPVTPWEAVLGKFLAAWVFAGIALVLTFPIWLTVNYLGDPDNGVILAAYAGSFLMAGAYLAIGSAISAATTSQVIAFIVATLVCFLFTVSGSPLVLDVVKGWAPVSLVEAISSFSFITHFISMAAGVIDLRDLIFFLSLIGLFLFATVLIVDQRERG